MVSETLFNRRREEFPTLASGIHLLSHSLGPVPRRARVSFRSSFRVDAKAIVERAHRLGALVLLDVYQSAGTVRLEAGNWDVDFMVGGTIKWLCGGPACGYLYVRPELQKDLQPRLTGW